MSINIGGTKAQEYQRSADLIAQVAAEQGIGMALWLLYDMQYDRSDIKAVADILTVKKEH